MTWLKKPGSPSTNRGAKTTNQQMVEMFRFFPAN